MLATRSTAKEIGHSKSQSLSRILPSVICTEEHGSNEGSSTAVHIRMSFPFTLENLKRLLKELYFTGPNGLLQDLRGIAISPISHVTGASRGYLSLIIMPPDRDGIVNAGPTSSMREKYEVLQAYSLLHKRNIIHGAVHPRHTWIGLNGIVTLINFQRSRVLNAQDAETPQILREEMNLVKSMLGLQHSIAESDVIERELPQLTRRKREYSEIKETASENEVTCRKKKLTKRTPKISTAQDVRMVQTTKKNKGGFPFSHNPALTRVKKLESKDIRKSSLKSLKGGDHEVSSQPNRGQLPNASSFAPNNKRTRSFKGPKITLSEYVSANSSPPRESSTTCEPPSPPIDEPMEKLGAGSSLDVNPNITLPSWRAFASSTAPDHTAPETTIQATRPRAPNELTMIHSVWYSLPTDLEPYFGSWMGLCGQHEIPVASIGHAWGHWLTLCAREYCKEQPGRVHDANSRAKIISPSLDRPLREKSTQAELARPSILPTTFTRHKRRRSI